LGEALEPIAFSPLPAVPSWSWMAYLGGIDYFDILVVDGTVEWNTRLELTQLDGFADCNSGSCPFRPELVADACDYDRATTDVFYDQPGWERGKGQKCVIVGRTEGSTAAPRAYYLLLVAPRTRGDDTWERCGVGFTDRAGALDEERVIWIRIT
jgi:hypothetical protein